MAAILASLTTRHRRRRSNSPTHTDTAIHPNRRSSHTERPRNMDTMYVTIHGQRTQAWIYDIDADF
jgi:hypothetical protein